MNLTTMDSNVVSTVKLFRLFGYAEHRMLKKVIRENLDSFEFFGGLRVTTGATGDKGGRPTQSYLLNFNHLLLLTAISKNSNKDIKKEMVRRIVDSFSNANLLSVLNLISDIDVADLPSDRYVYVARESVMGRYKIGISSNPERRLKELNQGNPEKLVLAHAYLASEGGYKSEALAHAIYEQDRIRGEWFSSGIDLAKLPSYSLTHVDSAECECEECALYSMALDCVDDNMTRDEAISAITNATSLPIEKTIKYVDSMIDLGVLD